MSEPIKDHPDFKRCDSCKRLTVPTKEHRCSYCNSRSLSTPYREPALGREGTREVGVPLNLLTPKDSRVDQAVPASVPKETLSPTAEEVRSGKTACANGHMWLNMFGADWTPDDGTPCSCGQKKWGVPAPATASEGTEPRQEVFRQLASRPTYLRIGQTIVNAVFKDEACPRLFYLSDADLLQALKSSPDGMRAQPQPETPQNTPEPLTENVLNALVAGITVRGSAFERATLAALVTRYRDADLIAEYRTIAPQLAERLAETRAELNNCETCDGTGMMQVLDKVLPPDEREVYAMEPCAQCDGDGKSGYVKLRTQLAETRAQVEQMREMAAEIRAEIDDQVSVNATPNQRAHATITIEVRSLMPLLDLFPATEPGGE